MDEIKMEYVDSERKKLSALVSASIRKINFEKALCALSVWSRIEYEWNQTYINEDIEQLIDKVAALTKPNKGQENAGDKDVILFYDGLCKDIRGLALNYLTGFADLGCEVLYVTEARAEGRQLEIDKVIASAGFQKRYISSESGFLGKLRQIQDIVYEYNPAKAFLYTVPWDSAGVVAFTQMNQKIERYQINLTDHAFWPGRKSFDYCIEFRNYGAGVSVNYRGIPKEKLILLPFYPWYDKKMEFQGIPFGLEGKQIIFSGGSLYKTIDEYGTYYHMVDKILSRVPDVVFLYAGTGDATRLCELMEKHKGRVFHISERADLYQLMRHITLYLNTYPLLGGLMTQYAVAAGKIPITLKHNNEGDGLLINQSERQIEYLIVDELVDDTVELLKNADYRRRRELLLDGAIVSESEFAFQLAKVLDNHRTDFQMKFTAPDTTEFRKEYIHRFSIWNMERIIASKTNISLFGDYWRVFLKKAIGKVSDRKICRFENYAKRRDINRASD